MMVVSEQHSAKFSWPRGYSFQVRDGCSDRGSLTCQVCDQAVSKHIGVKLPNDEELNPMSDWQVYVDNFQGSIDKHQLLLGPA